MQNPLEAILNETELDTEKAFSYVKQGFNANTKNSKGQTLLHRIVTRRRFVLKFIGVTTPQISIQHQEIIKELIHKYQADPNEKDEAGRTALQCLLDTDYSVGDVIFLAELGADITLENSSKQPIIFALALAKFPLSEQTKEVLYKLVHQYGVDINRKTTEGKTLLQCILDRPSWSAEDIKFLLSMGANPNACDSRGQPLFHRLVLDDSNHMSLISLLVDKYSVDPNRKNVEGKTALQCYIDRKPWMPDMMLFLVSLGADSQTMDSQGQSLIHKLVMYDRGERMGIGRQNKCAISILVEIYDLHPQTRNAQGYTALECLTASKKWTKADIDFLNSVNYYREQSIHPAVILKEGAIPSQNYPLVDKQVKHIVDPLQKYYDKIKMLFFGHNHLTSAQVLIEKILNCRRIPVILFYLRFEESHFDGVGACNFELATMDHDFLERSKQLSTMYKTKEESGYYRAISSALTNLKTIAADQQYQLQARRDAKKNA